MYKSFVIYLFLGVSLLSCSYFKPNKNKNKIPVAKVNETYLYKEELSVILSKNHKQKDSALLVLNYINAWAKQQLLLDKAKINLKEEDDNINKLVEKYKQDLYINKYREAVVTQNLDTIVREVDIDNFYVNNKEMLILKEDLIKFKFIQISKDIIDKEHIIKLFKSDKKEDTEELIEMELAFKSFHFNDSIWVKYVDVLKIVPVLNDYKKQAIKKNVYLVKEDSLDVYLIKINKLLIRNNISPKSYVVPTIKQMILHTRKLKLLKEIEQTILNDANKNGKYEIYK